MSEQIEQIDEGKAPSMKTVGGVISAINTLMGRLPARTDKTWNPLVISAIEGVVEMIENASNDRRVREVTAKVRLAMQEATPTRGDA